MLDAVARALLMTSAQRTQLYTLVRDDPRHSPFAVDTVRPTAVKLLDALTIPAIIVGRGTAAVASNHLHRALTMDFLRQEPERRYYAFWLFTEPGAQEILVDWARSARETVGVLRQSVTRFPDDDRLRALVDQLSALSVEFRELWSEHDVEGPSAGAKQYLHPVAGDITLLHEVAQLSEEHWLHLYWAESGGSAARYGFH